MYSFIPDVFHTTPEASSIIFDLRRLFFADAKIFELGWVCLSRTYIFKFFKGCRPQNLLRSLFNTLHHLFFR